MIANILTNFHLVNTNVYAAQVTEVRVPAGVTGFPYSATSRAHSTSYAVGAAAHSPRAMRPDREGENHYRIAVPVVH
jgi:hypothetical protein